MLHRLTGRWYVPGFGEIGLASPERGDVVRAGRYRGRLEADLVRRMGGLTMPTGVLLLLLAEPEPRPVLGRSCDVFAAACLRWKNRM